MKKTDIQDDTQRSGSVGVYRTFRKYNFPQRTEGIWKGLNEEIVIVTKKYIN